ncbi:MAG: hypothetical protein KME20_02650 [Kaiparowitsia implicata GSE-PSE-MK54-09C]|jgi:hypothetical protein|nr:hypothetical protein [Kaiparowitsia implicata GSE-PSE-MK54-09C]
MSSEIKALVRSHQGESNAQIWIIGTRDQVIHLMNELYVKKVATDRAQFTPIIPAPFIDGQYMTVLVRSPSPPSRDLPASTR